MGVGISRLPELPHFPLIIIIIIIIIGLIIGCELFVNTPVPVRYVEVSPV